MVGGLLLRLLAGMADLRNIVRLISCSPSDVYFICILNESPNCIYHATNDREFTQRLRN